MEGKRYQALDGLRGICALSVVLFHLRVAGTPTEWTFFRNADRFVEFFFVLSGFVLTHSAMHRRPFRFGTFAIDRVFRIFPLHLAMLGVFVLLETIRYLASTRGISLGGAPFSGHMALSQLLPNALLAHAWFPWTDPLSFNAPSWSISIEFYMYALFSVMIFSGRTALYVAFAVTIIALALYGKDFFTLEARRGLLCFFSGSLTYFLAFKYKSIFCAIPKYLYTFIQLIVTASLIYVIANSYYNMISISILFCSCVFVFSIENGLLQQGLDNRVFNYIGKLSYSVYLIHYCIILIFTYVLIFAGRFFDVSYVKDDGKIRIIDFGSSVSNNIFVAFTLALIVFASSLTFGFIEVRSRNLGKRLVAVLRGDAPPAHDAIGPALS